MEECVRNFYTYDFSGHLLEDDKDEGEKEIDFDTADIIEEDSRENHESDSDNDEEYFKLDSDSIDKEISILVVDD